MTRKRKHNLPITGRIEPEQDQKANKKNSKSKKKKITAVRSGRITKCNRTRIKVTAGHKTNDHLNKKLVKTRVKEDTDDKCMAKCTGIEVYRNTKDQDGKYCAQAVKDKDGVDQNHNIMVNNSGNSLKNTPKERPIKRKNPVGTKNSKSQIDDDEPEDKKRRLIKLGDIKTFNHTKKKEGNLSNRCQQLNQPGSATFDSKPTNNEEKNPLIFPRKPEEISCNWKKLQKVLHIKPKAIVKPETDSQKKHNQGEKEKPNTEVDIWFDDVDEVLIEAAKTKMPSSVVSAGDWNTVNNPLIKPGANTGLTKIVALDCEMVGTGSDGQDSILARVSIVNQFGQCIYDKYVKPTEEVTDYRTKFSGIRPDNLKKGEPFKIVQKEVYDIIKGRILVGHAIHHDLKVLFLDHPHKAIRDTSTFKPFKKLVMGRKPSLKRLAKEFLGVDIQENEHNSVQDAQATMRLYTMFRKRWETELKLKRQLKRKKARGKKKPSHESGALNEDILKSSDED